MTADEANKMAAIFHRFATPRRLQILRVLLDSDEPAASSTIAAVTGESEAATSFNLIRLAELGIVTRIPSGRWAFYVVNRPLMIVLKEYFVCQS